MTAEAILEVVRQAGGALWVEGGKLKYRLPVGSAPVLEELRRHKAELLAELARRSSMPAGVRLVRWEPKVPPIRLSEFSIVNDTDLFIHSTLRQVDARLRGTGWLAGNWPLSELLDRLAAVGCHVALDDPRQALQ